MSWVDILVTEVVDEDVYHIRDWPPVWDDGVIVQEGHYGIGFTPD